MDPEFSLHIRTSPVDKYFEVCLTGLVNHGVLFKVNCFVRNPSAAMRGGFLRWRRGGSL
jgi:hypothetical protein